MNLKVFITRLSIPPIFRTLARQKYPTLMLISQISIALAVIANGLFIAVDRFQTISTLSGIDESNSFFLTSSGFTDNFNIQNTIQSDLAKIRALPDVVNAVKTNSFPYSDSGDEYALSTNQDSQSPIPAASYKLDEHGIEALGLELIAGDNFSANEVIWQSPHTSKFAPHVLLTTRTAQALFNTDDWQSTLGEPIYIDNNQLVIVKGIIKTLHAPWPGWKHLEHSFITPSVVTHNSSRYLIRVKPGTLEDMMSEIESTLALGNKQRLIRKMKSISDAKKEVYGADLAALTILLVVIVSLSFIVGLGITGATSLKILKQTKQIGIRRALGANKYDIFKYFLLENLIITSIGIFTGIVFAIALNVFLVEQHAFQKLPLSYLIIAALVMYLLNIIATIKPILKAVRVSPITATQGN